MNKSDFEIKNNMLIDNAQNIDNLPGHDMDDNPKIELAVLRQFGIVKVRQLRKSFDHDTFNSVAEVVGADEILKIIFNISEEDICED